MVRQLGFGTIAFMAVDKAVDELTRAWVKWLMRAAYGKVLKDKVVWPLPYRCPEFWTRRFG